MKLEIYCEAQGVNAADCHLSDDPAMQALDWETVDGTHVELDVHGGAQLVTKCPKCSAPVRIRRHLEEGEVHKVAPWDVLDEEGKLYARVSQLVKTNPDKCAMRIMAEVLLETRDRVEIDVHPCKGRPVCPAILEKR